MAISNEILPNDKEQKQEEHSLKGALFSSILFVGGTIVLFTALLMILYIVRV